MPEVCHEGGVNEEIQHIAEEEVQGEPYLVREDVRERRPGVRDFPRHEKTIRRGDVVGLHERLEVHAREHVQDKGERQAAEGDRREVHGYGMLGEGPEFGHVQGLQGHNAFMALLVRPEADKDAARVFPRNVGRLRERGVLQVQPEDGEGSNKATGSVLGMGVRDLRHGGLEAHEDGAASEAREEGEGVLDARADRRHP